MPLASPISITPTPSQMPYLTCLPGPLIADGGPYSPYINHRTQNDKRYPNPAVCNGLINLKVTKPPPLVSLQPFPFVQAVLLQTIHKISVSCPVKAHHPHTSPSFPWILYHPQLLLTVHLPTFSKTCFHLTDTFKGCAAIRQCGSNNTAFHAMRIYPLGPVLS